MTTEESILEPSRTRKLISYFPYLLIIFSIVGFVIQLVLFQSIIFSIRSSVIFIPAALAGLFMLRKSDNGNQTFNLGRIADTLRNSISFKHLVIINIILFLWSIIVLLLVDNRNILFFILASSIASVILLQILHANTSFKRNLILVQISALSLTLAWSLTLKYSLYFGFTDTLSHMQFISSVVSSGHTADLTLTYINFPIYHILISEGVLLTGLGVGPALFVIMALVWLIGIFLSYLISKKISNSTTFGLLISLLFAVSPQIIYYSSYTITRSLAFIFFMLLIYLIFNKTDNNKFVFTVLSIFTSFVLILTHHITIIYVVPIILVIYIVQRLIVGNSEQESGISATFIILLSTTFLSYMIFASYDTTSTWIRYYLDQLLQDTGQINLSNTGGDLFIIIRSIYYISCLFFALIGFWSIMEKGRNIHSKERIFALSGLLFLPLFIPGVLDIIPGSGVLLLYRLPLLVTPFIAIILGYGILYFIVGNKSIVKASVRPMISIVSVLAIISVSSFFAMTGSIVDTPLPWNQGTSSDFFTVEETTAFANIESLGNHSQLLFSDDYSARNLYQLNDYHTRILTNGTISKLNSGYVVLRVGELDSRGVLQFARGTAANLYSYKIDLNDPQSNIILQLLPDEKLYDNGDVQSFYHVKSL
jgi:hypothetical protein